MNGHRNVKKEIPSYIQQNHQNKDNQQMEEFQTVTHSHHRYR